MKQIKLRTILTIAILFCCIKSFSQTTTTILYDASSNLSTTKCNVFDPPVNVGGLLHTSVIGVVGGGISLTSDNEGVSLAPNPASSMMQVSLKGTTGKTMARNISGIDVFDKLGNRVLTLKYGQSQTTVHLDISTLNPDVYMIKVFDGQS